MVGCSDQFAATVTVDATAFASGKYRVGVTANGSTTFCSFSFPPDPALQNEPCSAGFTLTVAPSQSCASTETDGARTLQCQPIAGKFTETITVEGTPQSVEVQEWVDGTSVFDKTISPTYGLTQPNGPACGPSCKQAAVAWTIPD
ncbi:MAG TPA: hypothetical protein VLT58_11255 [Polyangia bacterium]|nr:hypothetical protein [Polyangia bacterium]